MLYDAWMLVQESPLTGIVIGGRPHDHVLHQPPSLGYSSGPCSSASSWRMRWENWRWVLLFTFHTPSSSFAAARLPPRGEDLTLGSGDVPRLQLT